MRSYELRAKCLNVLGNRPTEDDITAQMSEQVGVVVMQ